MDERLHIFFSHGKFFDSFQDLLVYEKNWKQLPLDEESAERQLNILKREIITNIFMKGSKFNNNEFIEYIEKIFQFAIKELSCVKSFDASTTHPEVVENFKSDKCEPNCLCKILEETYHNLTNTT